MMRKLNYTLAPHLQRIVELAKNAPQWDTVNDRIVLFHVNKTPKCEHDAGNVLKE